jgi:PAS domain S-box-containing protein
VRALVVDPDARRRTALVGELERHDHDVRAAGSSAEALSLAAAFDPELVCVARAMGADDGLELCRALQSHVAGEERLLVVVGGPGEVGTLDALEAGAIDVWHLPADAGGALDARIRLAELYARLQAEHVRIGGEFALLRQALDLTGTGFILTDPRLDDDPIVYANRAFLELTGYEAHEVLGRNCRFLQGPRTSPEAVATMRERLEQRRPVTIELVNHRKDGTPFWNEVHVSPVHDESGRLVRFVGVQVDVTAYREQQRLFAREQIARAVAEAAERRSAFLAGAGPLLDASLDLHATVESLARLSVPFLGDVCLVEELRHGELRRLAVAATDPAVERVLDAQPAGRQVGGDDLLARVIRSGRPEIVSGPSPSVLRLAGRGPRAEDERQRAALVVPLRTRGRVIGALVVASLGPGREYGQGDLALAQDLAVRAALALDNARLFETQSAVAMALQAGLLPERLPAVGGAEVAARFSPAGDGSVIGGDFYDVLPRPGGFDLVIGDVTGKGARAAGLTGLVRHTLRTAARYEATPSRVLEVVNRALLDERGASGRYCTVALCRVELDGTARATLCCAGHPQPMVLRGDGGVEPVGGRGSVLGWVPDPRLVDVPFELAGGDAVVLFTDGVTEARTTGDAFGEQALGDLLRGAAGADAEGIAERVERAARLAGERRDDVAVLVSRVRRAGSA